MTDFDVYSDKFFNVNNPVIISLFIVFLLAITSILLFRYVVIPLQKKHLKEKRDIELKKAKMTALFAELAPDPLLRVNREGEIIDANSAALRLFPDGSFQNFKVNDFIPELKLEINSIIENDKMFEKNLKLGNYFFSITVLGISFENSAQIYFHDLTERKRSEDELQTSRNKLRELSVHLNTKLEEERQRIGRELHDVIGQNLLLMQMKLKNSGEFNSSNLDEMLKITLSDLREIMYDLKPKILEEMGLGPAIKSLIEKVESSTGLEGSVDLSGETIRLQEQMEIFIFRIVQESINNIIKHAKAKSFNIQLMYNDRITLMVSDDGIGFDFESQKKGMGLFNMKERVESYGGNFSIESGIGEGTLIVAKLPMEK